MNFYTTIIRAISPIDGKLKTYCGQNVQGISIADAQAYCENNGLGYCKVDALLIAEIPCKNGTFDPDMDNMIDYDNRLN